MNGKQPSKDFIDLKDDLDKAMIPLIKKHCHKNPRTTRMLQSMLLQVIARDLMLEAHQFEEKNIIIPELRFNPDGD